MAVTWKEKCWPIVEVVPSALVMVGAVPSTRMSVDAESPDEPVATSLNTSGFNPDGIVIEVEKLPSVPAEVVPTTMPWSVRVIVPLARHYEDVEPLQEPVNEGLVARGVP